MPQDKEKLKKVIADLVALTKAIEGEAKESQQEKSSLKDLAKTLDEIDDED